ncbi:MAG: cobalamin-dependent protein, partial [Kiritimatiellae bacterium]|nr:cobalamin-dependent protein [Kiritimatiellia bacterium]
MKVAIAYPPIISEKGVPLLSQNRQFQWFNSPTFIYPVVPACAATMAKKAGYEVFWLDGIAEQWTETQFIEHVRTIRPEIMMIEAKTPVITAVWGWINRLKENFPEIKLALVGDHVTAMPAESFEKSRVDFVFTGGDYDFLFLNLLSHLTKKEKLEPGIWYRENKQIR